ncbi:MAG TPA: biotin--[acetyl-CoA-carboxylase] ligase [Acidimicrobiia bacterium]|nr:biotin--[acetyl-CoA-carboxylase] ligase [Acidimicrobiia bacterium]
MRQPGPTRRAFTIEHLDRVDSTNRYVLDAARAGAPEGLVAVADHQTAGRGRLGRAWMAPPGASLLVSVLLRPEVAPDRLHVCTAAAALAMSDAVGLTAGFVPDLKWPNDLLAGGRKLAGLLAEVDMGPRATVRAVVVGIGVNVTGHELPAEIAETATACNLVAGREVSRDELLIAFLERLDTWLDTDDRSLLDHYRDRLITIGMRVRIQRADGSVVGVARGLDDFGGLVVDTDGEEITVAAGDVVHLRPS